MRDETDTIKELHATYNLLGGDDVPLKYYTESQWVTWRMEGYQLNDLRLVMTFIDRYNSQCKDPKYRRSKGFHKIVGDLAHFARMKAEAETDARMRDAKARAPVHGPRERILEATGRRPYLEAPIQTPEQVMRS